MSKICKRIEPWKAFAVMEKFGSTVGLGALAVELGLEKDLAFVRLIIPKKRRRSA